MKQKGKRAMIWQVLDKLTPGASIRSDNRVLNAVYLFVAKHVYWQEERAQERAEIRRIVDRLVSRAREVGG